MALLRSPWTRKEAPAARFGTGSWRARLSLAGLTVSTHGAGERCVSFLHFRGSECGGGSIVPSSKENTMRRLLPIAALALSAACWPARQSVPVEVDWTFGGQACTDAGVTSITIDIDGEVLTPNTFT